MLNKSATTLATKLCLVWWKSAKHLIAQMERANWGFGVGLLGLYDFSNQEKGKSRSVDP